LRWIKSPPTFVVVIEVYAFRAKLWQYHGPGAWYFISVPPDVADDIRARYGAQASGFGSIKVEATVRETQWTTSLFPDKTRRTYLLPIKKAVRVAENLDVGDVTMVRLRLMGDLGRG
jgi:Domain of unknown function (DUF1905)